MRPDLTELVRGIAALPQVEQVVMTTNGVGLAGKIRELKEAGLSGVNISLDSLETEGYRRIAGRTGAGKHWKGFPPAWKRRFPSSSTAFR